MSSRIAAAWLSLISAFAFIVIIPVTASSGQKIGRDESAQKKARSIQELLKALTSNDVKEMLTAETELIARKKQVMPVLLKMLEAGTRIPPRVYFVLEAMGPDAEAALPFLTRRLGNKDEAFRVAIAMERIKPGTLAGVSDESKQIVADAVYEAVTGPNGDSMGYSIGLLFCVGKSGTSHLLRLLQHKEAKYRSMAAEMLMFVQDPAVKSDRRVEAELVKLARLDEDDNIRAKAANALGYVGVGSAYAKSTLLELIRDCPPLDVGELDEEKRAKTYARRNVAGYAARSLGNHGPGVIDDLVPLISAMNAPSRALAMTALESIGPPAIPRLTELLRSKNEAVAISARIVLDRIGTAKSPDPKRR